jgi:hypothetical protein
MDTSLLARVERAERHARIIGAAVVIIAACFTWVLTTAASSSKIKAHSLTIVDDAGQQRIVLATKNGAPYIHLIDTNGKTRVALFVGSGDFGSIDLYNRDGTNIGEFAQAVDAPGGVLIIRDDNNARRAEMGIATDGTPAVWLKAPDGKTVQAQLGLWSHGPFLSLNDRSGTQRVYAGSYADDTYGMQFVDEAGTRLWKQP